MMLGLHMPWRKKVSGSVAGKNEAKIRFTAETEEFTSAIRDANSEMSTLRAEMKLNEAQFQNTGDQTEYLQQKAELLESQLQSNAEKQEALTQKLEAAKSIYGEDSEEVAKLERQLIYAQTEEEKLKSQLDDTNQSLSGQSQAAEEAGSSVDNLAEILVNAGIASVIKDMADAAYDMAGAFSEANAVIVEGTGASGEALEELNTVAREAFGQIADADQDLSGVANILQELNTRLGLTGEAAEDMTVKMANFAQHTGTDGTKAVDDVANVMKRWNLSMEDSDNLLDDLTTANQSCQMSVDEMSRYLSENSIQFQELGYSTEDAIAMLISLSDGGANVSSIMGGMKKAVGNLSNATNDVPGAFQEAIKAISECDTVSEALQAQVGDTGLTVEKVFGAKAAQELAANVQSGNFNIEEWTRVLQENHGALAQTTDNATTMEDAWSQATNNVSLALGGTLSPVISDVVIQISDVITKVAQVVQESPALQAVVIGVATALGILAAALGIASLISIVQKAFAMLNATMLMNPIFLVVTAIAALVAALVYAYNHSEKFRNIVNKAFTAVKTVVVGAINIARNIVSTGFSFIASTATSLHSKISTAFNAIKTAITTAIQTAKSVITTVFGTIRTTISNVVSTCRSAVTTAFNAIKTAMTHPLETARNTIKGILDKIKGFFPLKIGNIFSNLKLPHISVSAGKAPFGIGGKGSLPSFHVNWRAKGVIFDAPTLIPTLNGVEGVGEAGPEAVSPISLLQDYISAAVRRFMPQPIDYDLLGDKVATACAKMNITMEVNDRELGRVVREVV